MPRYIVHLLLAIGLAIGFVSPLPALAVTVWTGPQITFIEPRFANPTLPVNQDRLTAEVWLTRGDIRIYNARQETSYSGKASPGGTRWAFAGLDGNPVGPAFAAGNFAALTVSPGSPPSGDQGSPPATSADDPRSPTCSPRTSTSTSVSPAGTRAAARAAASATCAARRRPPVTRTSRCPAWRSPRSPSGSPPPAGGG